MRILGEKTGLKDRFRAVDTLGAFAETAKTIATPGTQQSEKQFVKEQTAKAVKEHDDIQHGQKSGSIESVHLTSAAASKEAQGSVQDKAEKQAKQRAEDMMFLSLLQARITAITKEINFLEDQAEKLGRTIDGMLNGTVSFDDALEQDHVKRAIHEWESRNPGRKFDPKAENADDLLLSIMEEQVQIDTDNVKGLQIEREALRSTAQEAVQRAAAGEPLEAIEADIMARHPDVYATHQAIGFDAKGNDELVQNAWDGQDEHSDVKADTEQAAITEVDDFGSFALNAAGEDVLDQFQTASASPGNESAPNLTPDLKNDLGFSG